MQNVYYPSNAEALYWLLAKFWNRFNRQYNMMYYHFSLVPLRNLAFSLKIGVNLENLDENDKFSCQCGLFIMLYNFLNLETEICSIFMNQFLLSVMCHTIIKYSIPTDSELIQIGENCPIDVDLFFVYRRAYCYAYQYKSEIKWRLAVVPTLPICCTEYI